MKKLLASIIFVIPFLSTAQKYEEAVYTVKGLAIKGYDPVAYFTEEKAIKGSENYSFDWNGSTWTFTSDKNRQAFKENPGKYAPQYGGYCAWGMSNGYKAKVDPENAWTIHNGKLYLNYSTGIKAKWLPEKDELIKVANENWKKFQ